MTSINQSELDQIKTLDQAIIWAVVSLEKSNKHPDNMWTSDNATVREGADEYCNYNIEKGIRGNGQFTFYAQFPLANHNPLAVKQSIIECIYTANPFTLVDNQIYFPSVWKGLLLPGPPAYVENLEQFLVWVCMIGSKALEIMAFVNSLIREKKSQFPEDTPNMITGDRCLQIAIDNDFYAFPLAPNYLGYLIEGDAGAGTAEGEIAQFDWSDIYDRPSIFDDDARENLADSIATNIDIASGVSVTDRAPVDTMPVCKEQDPAVANYAENDLITILNKK